MGLLRKVRVLMEALVHKPFAPKPEKVELAEAPASPKEAKVRRDSPSSQAQESELPNDERVADLLTQRQLRKGD